MREISHNIVKTRLNDRGIPYPQQEVISDLQNDLSRMVSINEPGYCGSCYGGLEPEGGCCQTCESVRKAYVDRGWAFSNPEGIDQCKKEGWTEKIQVQAKDGCRISGRVRIKKVQSSLVFSFGQSFQSNSYQARELVPYLKDGPIHDFGHMVHELKFESDDEYDLKMAEEALRVKKKLGVDVGPLNKHDNHYAMYTGVSVDIL
jgi:endoplasmic reticulum-Golgi intermediate compartment protein 3